MPWVMPMLGLKSESIGGSKEPVLKNFLPNAGLVFGFLCFSLSAGADSSEGRPASVTVHVLGVAQDAGNPQINCYKPRCLRVWETPALSSAGSSLAVVVDAQSFHLFDVSPGLPKQLFRLWQDTGLSLDQLDGVWLTHAHMGHYTGLIHFGKEAAATYRKRVFAMPRMAKFLRTNGPWDQLVKDENIQLQGLSDHQAVRLPALTITPWQVPHRDEYSETVGYLIEGPSKSALYLPDIDKWQKWSKNLVEVIADVDFAFLDATFYSSEELPSRDLSEIPHPTVMETLDLLAAMPESLRQRVIFTHMNHSNPLHDPTSEAFKTVSQLGYRVARVGDQFAL
ncbi:MAG: hypothetical protein CBC55_06540 [Gammaproteobacteria bacterium TMED95]|nr:pyrroloquinoline quinone biosynthesis protein PqqB [Gammaproteobacteria bacterium]OUV21270.1 MAG: hypothetical protein CBC55_06540 [Gammaproteobacteria bacterium TMED95]